MDSWLSKKRAGFNKDEFRVRVSKINWNIHKRLIISEFENVVRDAKSNGIDLFYYDYKDQSVPNKESVGYDGVALRFTAKFTGNGYRYKNNESIHTDLNFQHGATLHVTYSAIGLVLVFLTPSTSKDSLADHPTINLYSTYDSGSINAHRIKPWIKKFFAYQRITGVLYRRTLYSRLLVTRMRLNNYFKSYLLPDEKFKRISGIYIPGWALIFVIITVMITLYPILTTTPK
ncbi:MULTISPECIES: hypothetical protein [Serratia]|uniref:hypothetical protein n=1 Tax=Serratia TaxID=613 RepID=UPI0010223661|nr:MULTISPECIES: hypothetical protein [Serratia]CAI1552101.1 Uncharacterised protein [Serratia quinivorans]